jgi:DNA-binding transcriptional ArsR family regulator
MAGRLRGPKLAERSLGARPPPRSEAEARLDELDRVLDALAHPARRQILLAVHLRGEAMSAGDIAGRFHAAWPTTTRHLRVLEGAGLLSQRRQGRQRLYSVNTDRLTVAGEWLAWFRKDKD